MKGLRRYPFAEGLAHCLCIVLPLGLIGAWCISTSLYPGTLQVIGFVLWLAAWLAALALAITTAPRSGQYAAGVGTALALAALGFGTWLYVWGASLDRG